MPIFSWCFGNRGIQFYEIAIGQVRPLAYVRLNKIFMGTYLKVILQMEWEATRIRIRWVDKIRLKDEFRLTDMQVENLEKYLYWEYAKIVRNYVYAPGVSPLDYAAIVGNNLLILRESTGLTIEESAGRMGISPCLLRDYELKREI